MHFYSHIQITIDTKKTTPPASVLPAHRGRPPHLQLLVDLAEHIGLEEAVVRAEWRRMHASHHVGPAFLREHVDLRLGVASHEQEDGVGPHVRNEPNGVVGEPLPHGHVAPRLAGRYRQGRVEQAYVLGLKPPGEVAVLEGVRVGVLVLELLENVLERGRNGRRGRRDREG